MTTELKIIDYVEKSQVLFFSNSEDLTSLEISMQDFEEENFISLHIEKQQAKQIITFLQNHFNL
jgi:hypothetical protein